MAMTLGALHKPMNDFFLSRFSTATGSPVLFRFDKFGSVISDDDFLDPTHPEAGYNEAIARERVSELVNRAPVDAGDGINLILTSDSIDSMYFDRMLSPAEPYLPPGTDEHTRESIITNFSRIKSSALKRWELMTLESITGSKLSFRASDVSPARWYDPTEQDGWTKASFDVTDNSDDDGAGANGSKVDSKVKMQWRLKPDDAVLTEAFNLPGVRAANARPDRLAAAQSKSDPLPGINLGIFGVIRRPKLPVATPPKAKVVTRDHRTKQAGTAQPSKLSPGERLRKDMLGGRTHSLELRDRMLVRQFVEENVPARAVETNEISVSFEYCVVDVRRDWYNNSFINDATWHIPHVAKGERTSGGRPGSMPLIQVGFLVIRGLLIKANWSDEDMANALSAMSFGPFSVRPSDSQGELSQPGQQVIGWFVEILPPLPPNPAPMEAPAAARNYTVQKGDTLWLIAQRSYGDPSRWTEIVQVNGLTNPDSLEVGQVLVLP